MNVYDNLSQAILDLEQDMEENGEKVHTEKWQSLDIKDRPEAQMVEILHRSFIAHMNSEELEYFQRGINPNLPWADDHFDERVCGLPLNPGTEWANWPWSRHADGHRQDEKFNHNYMERYWPKFADAIIAPTRSPKEHAREWIASGLDQVKAHKGIRHYYGDLGDVIELLAGEPQTRQAYLPIWFPEDTGITHSGRKPCTLGYHFIMRNGELDVRYDIRSCDLFRHLRDDIYLTVRLALHILEKCRDINPEVWSKIKPGKFIMNITSLHMFISDYYVKFKHQPK